MGHAKSPQRWPGRCPGGRDRRANRWPRVRKRADVGGVVDGCRPRPLDGALVQRAASYCPHVRGAPTKTTPWRDDDPGSSHDLRSDLPDSPGRAEDTDNRGVSDPTGGPGAAFAIHDRGRSRPVSCSNTTARRLNGRQNTPPYASDIRRGNVSLHKRLAALDCTNRRVMAFADRCDSEGW